MASSAVDAERTPLLPSSTAASSQRPTPPIKPTRSVTFNPQISTASPPTRFRPTLPTTSALSANSIDTLPAQTSTGTQSKLSALNSKLRRRNSSGAPLQVLPNVFPAPKIGPQRTTRTAQKLKLLPNPEHGDEGPDEESGREVYSQFTRIKDPTARRDAARLGKDDRDKLPRVTAFCTANSYRIDDLMRFLKGRAKTKGTQPKLFDECIYTPYSYRDKNSSGTRRLSREEQEQHAQEVEEVRSQPQRRFSDSAIEVEEHSERQRENLIDMQNEMGDAVHANEGSGASQAVDLQEEQQERPAIQQSPDFDTVVHVPEVFLFEYGVVVIWGMTAAQEQRFLKEIAKFEQEKLSKDDVQVCRKIRDHLSTKLTD